MMEVIIWLGDYLIIKISLEWNLFFRCFLSWLINVGEIVDVSIIVVLDGIVEILLKKNLGKLVLS